MTKLHPYLNFAGNAEEAFEFYRSVFGGEFSTVARFSDMPMPADLSEQDRKKIAHISLPIGDDAILMASDTLEAFGQVLVQGNNAYISDQPWSDYWGSFKDKFGVMWMVSHSTQQPTG